MTTIKYTSDGKKVSVVGKLNSGQTIVQEIFIINGAEIPSGENFVVSSIHDAPAISWKESKLKELEDRYEKERKDYEFEIDKLRESFRKQKDLLTEKIKWSANAVKNVSPDSFNLLVDYLSGNITHVVCNNYTPTLIEWKDFIQLYENKLRLISIYGKDDGTLSYAIGQYNDYSGSDTFFFPFTHYDYALNKLKELLFKRGINDETLKTAGKHNIKFPDEQMKEWKEKQIKNIKARIEESNKKIEQWNDDIKLLTVE